MPDWHERALAGLGDLGAEKDKTLEKLKRAATPADLFKSNLEAERKISEMGEAMKGMVRVPGADAKPEDVAAFRKAIGVPDAPDGYKAFRPEGLTLSPADEAREKEFLADMHKAGQPQAAVEAAMKFHYAAVAREQQRFEAEGKRIAGENLAALKKQYGSDEKFGAMLNITNRLISATAGPAAEGLMNVRLADGTALGENAQALGFLFKLAEQYAPDGPLISSVFSPGVDVSARKAEILKLVGTPEYEKPEIQSELDKLIALEQARGSGTRRG